MCLHFLDGPGSDFPGHFDASFFHEAKSECWLIVQVTLMIFTQHILKSNLSWNLAAVLSEVSTASAALMVYYLYPNMPNINIAARPTSISNQAMPPSPVSNQAGQPQ